MLEQILRHVNNWFLMPDGIHASEFTVQDGGIVLPFLQDGQYFRVVGSIFNDGLHQYPADGLTDETFDGAVWALAVPEAFLALVKEIEAYQAKQGEPGPYTSESFGGYTYTKATNSKGVAVGWQEIFAGRLNEWRRIGGI